MVGAAPRVSVIVVFYNPGWFLEEALQSVLAQTYSDWELLLVDDGSTDESSTIARRHATEHPGRIRYLEHAGRENRGASASRNLGVAHAAGEYIALLDADDVLLPEALARQVTVLDRMPDVAMPCGRSLLWHSWADDAAGAHRDRMTRPAPHLDVRYAPPELLLINLRDHLEFYPTTGSTLIRRAVVQAVGGFEEEFRNTYEDMTLFLKIFLEYPVYVSGECWHRYRQHAHSTWSVAQRSGQYRPGRSYPARERFLRWLQQYLENKDMTDTAAWQAVQRELRVYRYPLLEWPLWLGWKVRRIVTKRTQPMVERLGASTAGKAVTKRLRRWPPLGWVRFGSLRRLQPISQQFGFDRGTPVDRYYIERFLAAHAEDVRGHVLEVGGADYTREYGKHRVTAIDVLHVNENLPEATIIADLASADHIPSERFDCIIITQTLQYIFDGHAAVRTLYRILKPGGVVLATLPGITETGVDYSGAGWHWSFTPLSARRLFADVFGPTNVEAEGHGNVLAAISFLHGVSMQELREEELDYRDPRYVVSTTVRAVKPAAAG